MPGKVLDTVHIAKSTEELAQFIDIENILIEHGGRHSMDFAKATEAFQKADTQIHRVFLSSVEMPSRHSKPTSTKKSMATKKITAELGNLDNETKANSNSTQEESQILPQVQKNEQRIKEIDQKVDVLEQQVQMAISRIKTVPDDSIGYPIPLLVLGIGIVVGYLLGHTWKERFFCFWTAIKISRVPGSFWTKKCLSCFFPIYE